MAFRMATVMAVGFKIGITTPKKVCKGLQPSIMAASSMSSGIDLMNPQNMNTDRPEPNPRYSNTIPGGLFRWVILASLDIVNITIWKGTIMENTNM